MKVVVGARGFVWELADGGRESADDAAFTCAYQTRAGVKKKGGASFETACLPPATRDRRRERCVGVSARGKVLSVQQHCNLYVRQIVCPKDNG